MELSILLDAVKEWAMREESIRLVLVLGSEAYNQKISDSSVDLMLITSNPRKYALGTFFYGFGKVIRCQKENLGAVVAIRAFYQGGCSVKFLITSPDLLKLPYNRWSNDMLSRGYKSLVDKENTSINLIGNSVC